MNSIISIPVQPDDKGYLDRQCPNEKCMFIFKVNLDEWQKNFVQQSAYCPMCGFSAALDKWYTEEQIETINENAKTHAIALVHDQVNKMFANSFSKMSNKHVKVTYTPGNKITPKTHPIKQRTEWEQEITCNDCNFKFSVIGSAFFCPCCGKNQVCLVFENAMKQITVKLNTINDIRQTVTQSAGTDNAERLCRKLIEDCIGDIVSAFQKYAEQKIKDKSPQAKVVVNDFQIIDKGNRHFMDYFGCGYDTWLSNEELILMNLFFQRRHLLEHNNGLVDQRYLDKSNDTTYKNGQRIIVSQDDIMLLLNIVNKLHQGISSIQ